MALYPRAQSTLQYCQPFHVGLLEMKQWRFESVTDRRSAIDPVKVRRLPDSN